MNTHTWFERVSAYYDGEVSPRELAAVEQHMKDCVQCRTFLHDLREMRRDVRAAGTYDVSLAFASRTARRAVRDEGDETVWLGVEQYARRAVLALAALVLTFIAWTSINAMNNSVVLERRITGESIDSLESHVLLKQTEISNQDIFLAVVSK